jgi:hypothetical protein
MSQEQQDWPHDPIKEIFDNIFFVTGTNITHFEGVDLQHSRNMVIVRDNGKLSLINTVKLSDEGLQALEKLGDVKNVIRIGAFHGRDDAFYVDKYDAKLWALPGMQDEHGKQTDVEFKAGQAPQPFSDCDLFIFETSKFPEGIIHMQQHGGILISCDSIKNWISPDEFFSEQTAALYQQQGFFGKASISTVWQQACQVAPSDFARLKDLSFRHLISAHGEPLLDEAYDAVIKSVNR